LALASLSVPVSPLPTGSPAYRRQCVAAAGDLAAQREELTGIKRAIEEGAAYHHTSPEWLAAARPDLLPEIEGVLVAIARRVGPSEWDLGRSLSATLERLGAEEAVAIYDRLIADDQAIGAGFWRPARLGSSP
jgi:hypothetical protein